jgi:hypothetical protein
LYRAVSSLLDVIKALGIVPEEDIVDVEVPCGSNAVSQAAAQGILSVWGGRRRVSESWNEFVTALSAHLGVEIDLSTGQVRAHFLTEHTVEDHVGHLQFLLRSAGI